MYKRILVPTDGSETALLALDAALYLARSCGSDIVALSVASPQPWLGAVEGGLVSEAAPHAGALLRQAEERAAAVAARAQAVGLSCSTVAVHSLSPGQAIIDTALEYQCALIVMGSHGERGVGSEIAGSVTRHVLAYSAIPVMVLRPQRQDAPVPGDS
jgi:nucleotide-binding universal stress UspA family protein